MMSLWDALRMNMMISYQELVRTFPGAIGVKECYLFADKYTFVHVSLSYITDNHRLLINSH